MAKFSEDFICYQPHIDAEDKKLVMPLLWPVYVWQVYGPDSAGKTSNVFERSLLSLLSMRKGARLDASRVEELARWLGLEPDMVSYIIEQQLKPKGWLDSKTGGLTKEGHEAIHSETLASGNLQIGYVFQDAVDGQMLPRYASSIPSIEPMNQSPLEFSFSKASNWTWRPSVVRGQAQRRRPSVADLRNVVKVAQQANRNAQMMDSGSNYDGLKGLDDLELASSDPIRAYLWVWVYPDTQQIWSVADPFGLHPQVDWMREKVESVCNTSPQVSRRLMQIIGVDDDTDGTSMSGILAAREEQARLEVLTEYGQADQVDGLALFLLGWMHRKLEVETSDSTDRFHDYRDLITQSSSLIEHCVRFCLERFPLKNPQIIPRSCDKTGLIKLVSDAVPSLTASQIEEVVKVNSRNIFSAAKFKQGSYRRCMAASLLSFPDYAEHPLKEFIRNEFLFLGAYRLSHWRDKTAHSEGGFNVSKEMSMEACAVTDAFLKTFFKGLSNG